MAGTENGFSVKEDRLEHNTRANTEDSRYHGRTNTWSTDSNVAQPARTQNAVSPGMHTTTRSFFQQHQMLYR